MVNMQAERKNSHDLLRKTHAKPDRDRFEVRSCGQEMALLLAITIGRSAAKVEEVIAPASEQRGAKWQIIGPAKPCLAK